MAAPSPYTFRVNPIFGNGEDESVHQSNPTWVLTFARFNIRDPMRTHTGETASLSVRDPVVVENDCIDCRVTYNKGSLSPTMQCVLMESDINYETAIAPGDFVMVNMLNWERDARNVAIKAKGGKVINEFDDGFKGLFKVQSVRRTIAVEPSTGTRTVRYNIDGFAFTEFNNVIYFNPNLINQKSLANAALYISDIAEAWKSYATKAGKPPLQEILAFLIQHLVGCGINPKAAMVGGMVVSPNKKFVVPALVGRYLGVVNDDKPLSQDYAHVQSAADIYNYLFGLQTYAGSSPLANIPVGQGLNPSNVNAKQKYPNFYYTKIPCPGNTILKAEYWNQVKVWSILNQYVNSPLNELYTCFKVNAFTNRVMPTVVFRQIPFTSEDFSTQQLGPTDTNPNNKNINITRFMTLPRWWIHPAMVKQVDLGKDEAARINFVQFYAKSAFSDKGVDMSGETAKGNYYYDPEDIKRSGLRPYIIQNQMEDLPDALINSAPKWARIVADAVIGGHLKQSGTIICNGIVDPITVGDNLEFDGTVFHIEQISHAVSINPTSGHKSFTTSISVSHGVSVHSSQAGTHYPEMYATDAYLDREDDFLGNQLLPGISENQDTQYREPGIERSDSVKAGRGPNRTFDQPNLKFKKTKTKQSTEK